MRAAIFLLYLFQGDAFFADMIPQRARNGKLYQDALLSEVSSGARNLTVNWYNQPTDHFSDPSLGTFSQRWWVDYSNWDGTGPCFLYISGEAPASGSPGGFAQTLGAKMGALLVTLEHRWYGESLPGELSNTALLKASLTVDQVMEDLAGFVQYLENNVLPRNPQGGLHKWLAIGGSYAGALSAWVREKHPETFVASWSSSGVVNAIFNFTAFDQYVQLALPQKCQDSLRAAMTQADAQWTASLSSRAALLKLFGTPSYFTEQDFLWMLADSSAMGPQYGYKDLMCAYMATDGYTELENLKNWTIAHYGPDFTSSCYYSTECLSDVSYSDQWGPAGYSWVFQTCSQLAYWQAASSNSIRSQLLTTEYFVNQCHQAFGKTVNADTVAFNSKYGGATPNATFVIALQGSDDPWQPAGVQSALGPHYPEATAICDGCGHCGDLGTSSLQAIINQQNFISSTLENWLA